MDARVEKLAAEIASLEEAEQKTLLERAAELSFRRGLLQLSEKYRKRLQQEGERDQTATQIMAKLKQLREEIAAREYSG
ncbi:MAG TPA: hypothetical protein VGL70_24030 [Candidatus Binatia bacterium]|jgi:hypothetical protein